MPKLKHAVPKLHRHVKGQAFVKIDGRQVWLGRHGDPIAQEKYDRLIGEWLANGRRLPQPEPAQQQPHEYTVAMMVNDYRAEVEATHRPDHANKIRLALLRVVRLYGSLPAHEFCPLALEAVRESWVTEKRARSTINEYVGYIRAAFRWAVAKQKLHESVFNALHAVDNLRKGKSKAKESKGVKPVKRAHVRRVRRRLARPVRVMIALQLLTGARPGELVKLRGTDIKTRSRVWTYELAEHKTAHHDKGRIIMFGPRAQRVLKMILRSGSALDDYLFRPADAIAELKARGATVRRRPNQKPSPRLTERMLNPHYDVTAYRKAISRACEHSGVPAWSPHQLRHNAATFLRRQFGIDVARAVLGHSSPAVTELYAERDRKQVEKIMAEVG